MNAKRSYCFLQRLKEISSAMSDSQTNNATFTPVRACIFDVDGLLINSEDIYTEIYNNILHSYGKPDLPWSIKAKQQSRGREVYCPHPHPTFAVPVEHVS